MKLFQRIFFAAVLAGLVAGVAMAAVQQWKVAPLILEAEVLENAASEAAVVEEHTHEAGAAAHVHDARAWAPQDGAERIFYTVLADVLVSMGFALVLAAVSVIAGLEITARNGVIWGFAGFAAFQLAPAFGLPPELPGMAAADLGLRQVWWWGTALATGAAFLTAAKLQNWTGVGIAVGLVVLPHIIGAPTAPDESTAVPAHLATEFAARTLFTGAVFWLIVGPLLGWLNARFASLVLVAPKGAAA
jgi:cobalt transporter subunit CbtA